MPWDPKSSVPFGAYMRGGEPLGEGRSVDVVTGERTSATQDQVLVDTPREKRVMDQNGHVVTERTDKRGGYHRDVRINLR